MSDETLASLRCSLHDYVAKVRLAGAAKLYEVGRVSQELAAEIAGLPRAEFIARGFSVAGQSLPGRAG